MANNTISVELQLDPGNNGNNSPITDNKINSIVINQAINHHHHFEIILRADVIEDKSAALFQRSRDCIGKKVKIKLYDTLFVGIVTMISSTKSDGATGYLKISGYSPTFFLDDNPNTQSFSNKTLQEIIKGSKKPYPENEIHFKNENINPRLTAKFEYTTQYGESSFNFINRLALNYGEWFFYDGQQTYFGLPGNSNGNITLYYGSDLVSLNISMKVEHVDFKRIYHNYEKNQVVTKTNNDAQQPDLDNLSKFAFDTSGKLAGNTPEMLQVATVVSSQQVDQQLKLEMAANTNRFVVCNGVSTNSSLKIGSVIEIKKKASKDGKEENYGNYRIINLTHSCTGNGVYQNNFLAVPEALQYAPGMNRRLKPVAPAQTAIVKKNNDPLGLGRVQVQLLWQEKDELTPWIRVTTPYAGKGRGFFLPPEPGDEVLVNFHNGDPDTPYVIGSLYNGQAKPGGRGIVTVGGNCIVFGDGKDKQKIDIYNGKNKISLSCEGDGTIVLASDGNISLQAGRNLFLHAKENVEIFGNEVMIGAQPAVALGKPASGLPESGINFAPKGILINTQEKMNLKTDGGDIVIQTGELSAKADTSCKLESLQISLEAVASLEMDGGGTTSLKGGVVKIN
jgi:type VI secretion system secreted protein VgrG